MPVSMAGVVIMLEPVRNVVKSQISQINRMSLSLIRIPAMAAPAVVAVLAVVAALAMASQVANRVANRMVNLMEMANVREMTAQITTLALACLARLIFIKNSIKMALKAFGVREALK